MFVKVTVICLALIVQISCTQAWMARGNYHSDDHPGKCAINSKLVISPGESTKDPDSCTKITCSNSKGDAMLYGCGVVMDPPNCTWDGYVDINAPFPLCCLEKINCPNPADLTYAKMLQDNMRITYTEKLNNNE